MPRLNGFLQSKGSLQFIEKAILMPDGNLEKDSKFIIVIGNFFKSEYLRPEFHLLKKWADSPSEGE